MSLCTVCGRYLCDHTLEERGQTEEEMMAPLTPGEKKAWEENPDSTGYIPAKMEAARQAHEEYLRTHEVKPG